MSRLMACHIMLATGWIMMSAWPSLNLVNSSQKLICHFALCFRQFTLHPFRGQYWNKCSVNETTKQSGTKIQSKWDNLWCFPFNWPTPAQLWFNYCNQNGSYRHAIAILGKLEMSTDKLGTEVIMGCCCQIWE